MTENAMKVDTNITAGARVEKNDFIEGDLKRIIFYIMYQGNHVSSKALNFLLHLTACLLWISFKVIDTIY